MTKLIRLLIILGAFFLVGCSREADVIVSNRTGYLAESVIDGNSKLFDDFDEHEQTIKWSGWSDEKDITISIGGVSGYSSGGESQGIKVKNGETTIFTWH